MKKINAKDNDPLYRDEQRAWYDTLRDFLPSIMGLKPTIRLIAKDDKWCSLNPNELADVKKFEIFLGVKSKNWEIEVKEDPSPFLARIIVAGDWGGKPEEAKKLLEDIWKRWPSSKKVKFLITCGGFIQFDWPESISRMNIGDNKNPNEDSVNVLMEEAEKCAKFVLGEGLDEKLREFADHITLGIDSSKEKISTTQNYIPNPHIELVSLIDLRNNKFYWTGKSYSTNGQEKGLVRISDSGTHFLGLKDVGKLMMLGCHDLTVFNPRSRPKHPWRRDAKSRVIELAKRERPICVLQHPHTTVKIRTWLNAWNGLRKILPSVERYAGAGRYYEPDRGPSEWDDLDDVLKSTKCGDTIDFIVYRSNE